MNHQQIFDKFPQYNVAVVGDVMLDTYWFGSVDRVSPEAPVPIVAINKREVRIGGAGNVALNLSSLGANATVFSVTGNDEESTQLLSLFQQHNIGVQYVVKSGNRVTTNKTRIISRNQQMMRIDSEITTSLTEQEESALIANFRAYVAESKPAVAIFEDYNKGVLTPTVIKELIAICNENEIVTTVDPKRKNFFAYQGVTIFKPNLVEVKDALNLLNEEITEASLRTIHVRLKEKLQHEVSLITLSERGVFYQHDSNGNLLHGHIRNVADVSGAGDTVIAVASLVYAATKDVAMAASIANIAGGLVCEEVGTIAIDRQKLLNECSELL